MMHGGACIHARWCMYQNGKTRASIGLQPFFAFEALIVIYSLKWGTFAPPALPLALSCRPPTGGKYPAIQSEGHLCPYF